MGCQIQKNALSHASHVLALTTLKQHLMKSGDNYLDMYRSQEHCAHFFWLSKVIISLKITEFMLARLRWKGSTRLDQPTCLTLFGIAQKFLPLALAHLHRKHKKSTL
jgi:hypothetical protein